MGDVFAEVALDLAVDHTFTYRVPEALREAVAPGRRVRVPFRNREVTGYCVALSDATTLGRVLDVAGVLDAEPLISAPMLELTRWMAEYYCCGWGQALDAAVPGGVKRGSEQRTETVVELAVPVESVAAKVAELEKRSPKQAHVLEVLASLRACTSLGQGQIGRIGPIGRIEEAVTLDELARLAGCTTAPIQGLRAKKLVLFSRRKTADDPLLSLSAAREAPLVLEPAQQAALDRILVLHRRGQLDEVRRGQLDGAHRGQGDEVPNGHLDEARDRQLDQPCDGRSDEARHRRLDETRRGRGGVVLVHGVTGSGKTEIYLQAIAEVVAGGKGAIVLVPEIALTPQTVRRFKARFDHVAVLHSHLTESQRHEQWREIRSGRTQVVVGARSAIFAPMPRLGLIVVDEEHETSFKQDQAPRYNARDVAVMRGRFEDAVVVLGSATPSLESYYNARSGKYEMAHLPGRVMGRPMPKVEVVDMTKELAAMRQFRFLSRRLAALIEDRITRNEQVILFLNRRGFATYVFCGRCGWAMRCSHCDIAMTYHKRFRRALCHYCGARTPLPELCPECKGETVKALGLGTERIEEEVNARFPGVACERMDSDAVRGRGAHQRVLDAFRDGRVRILVGTQMIAKGLDFPNVTLVGVVNADSALHLPDFRAGERTHQLVSQVAGRTGRGPKGGLVVVQTSQPEHYTMRTAAAHDYIAFAEVELEHRRTLHLPPFGRAARIVLEGRNESEVRRYAGAVGDALAAAAKSRRCLVHGPMPCPIERVKDRFRWHLLLLAGKWSTLRDMIVAARPALPKGRRVHVAIDVDPVSML